MRNNLKLVCLSLVSTLAVIAPNAFAAATDYTSITSAVDFASVATGVVSIAALLAVAIVAWKGSKMLLSAIR